jgi:hypothetical protein
MTPADMTRLRDWAAVAVTAAQMGGDSGTIIATVGPYMERLGFTSAQDARDVAAAISRLPQPVDDPPERRERLRKFEEMVGAISPEQQLLAALAAREALNSFALEIERSQ